MSDGLHESFHKGVIKRQAERIAELEAEVKAYKAGAESELARSHRYEARLAAVIALCDERDATPGITARGLCANVRAAATGATK